jgi:hypothetical protein
MRHGSCPSDASQSKSPTQAHERIGAGSGFPAADGPRGTSRPREQRRIHGVPAHLKEDEAHGSHGRLGLRNPTGTDCPQGPKNPEAAANGRDRLSLTNVGDARRSEPCTAQPIPRQNHRGDVRKTAGGSSGSDKDPKPGGQEQHCEGLMNPMSAVDCERTRSAGPRTPGWVAEHRVPKKGKHAMHDPPRTALAEYGDLPSDRS